jgi:hypothetical protein
MWEKPYISIFVEIGIENGCHNDHHFEIALVNNK